MRETPQEYVINKPAPTHDQIAAAAHQLYIDGGCRDGDDWGDWFRAEELLTAAIREIAPEPADDIEDLWWTAPRTNYPLPDVLVPVRSRKVEDRGTIRRPVEHIFA